MLNLLGEYHCRIDAKGRVSFPAKLRKQLDRVLHDGLVVNRDIFEGCLVIYPKLEWDRSMQRCPASAGMTATTSSSSGNS